MTETFYGINIDIVKTQAVEQIVGKALHYLQAGFPVHFSGPAGTGKTTLAMYAAEKIAHPVVLIRGNDEFTNSDLVGGDLGIRRKKVIDNYIHSVWKGEESVSTLWYDGRLTRACRTGATLVYDEFTRSRPEANNVLLSVLEERILDLSQFQKGEQILQVHPLFCAIFTSNPEEYAGVHKYQDALRDRMITIDLSYYDRETEIAITVKKSGLPDNEAEKIVNLVRDLRYVANAHYTPSIRASIMIAKVCKNTQTTISREENTFKEVCLDVLSSEASNLPVQEDKNRLKKTVEDLINLVC